MTTIVTILLGTGVLFIASGLECAPLVATFQKIINNQAIDWSGNSGCTGTAAAATPSTATPSTATPSKVAPNGVGQCPPGYLKAADGSCYSTAGI